MGAALGPNPVEITHYQTNSYSHLFPELTELVLTTVPGSGSMGLKNSMTFLRSELTTIVDRIKGVGEGLRTVGTIKALTAFAGTAMFVRLRMTA